MRIENARNAAHLLEPLLHEDKEECAFVLHLDSARELIAVDRFSGRGLGEMELPVRAILKAALARDASGLIVAHNHPSGDPQPSGADVEATRRLVLAAAELDIRVHDHIVFAGGSCRSFRELGLL